MNMSIFAKFLDIEQKYKVKLHKGENFKQALYNYKMTDSDDCIIDKIELVIKHYPDSKNILLSTYSSDETSEIPFCYAVVVPH
ncbi:hypothetical protein J512_4075 [Acinetobacter baumannii 1295743]|uniref:Uncharacterized protein n=2 Tax=Pseudomonadota TaxID=1224 RepID=A0A009HGV8_ACIB9|nr:hypothetical protein J512_4075 [Acinetobacter baumannii 1295743]